MSRFWCRWAHRRDRLDDGPRAVWCRRCGDAITVTITVDTSKFDAAMRSLQRSIAETSAVIGARIAEGLAPMVTELGFRFWLDRSGQRVCLAGHETLIGRCPSCGATT